jgi:membrane-bound serine protease (ClpP class)
VRRARLAAVLIAALALGVAGAAAAGAQAAAPQVVSLHLTGVVDPFVANYIAHDIQAAADEHAAAVLITIDTPGGLDSSMRKIVKAILASPVPVICYTAPPGARAASAGTFVMLACPINAMAPGTNIGAAHPVGVAGAIEQTKVTNDAAAFIRSLADQWSRNADWAEQAVRNSVSVSAEEALSLHVVDLIAPTTEDLLAQVDGRSITLPAGETITVHTAGARLDPRGLGLGAALLHGLIDPNLAFIFFYLGLVLIVIEILHPGISVPGVVGTLMLVTSFVTFGLLPVELGGVVLLMVSAVFFLFDLKHPGLGLPTIGGTVTLILGGLLLFDPSVPSARVSPWVLAVVAGALLLFFVFVVRAAVAARRLPKGAGLDDLVGEEGEAVDDLAPDGRVRARREVWSASSAGPPIASGSRVRIVRREGLRLVVEPVPAQPEGRVGSVPASEAARRP